MISQQLGFIPQNTAQVRNQTLQEQETGADVGWLCPMCGTGQATPVLAELPVHPQHHELPHSPVCTPAVVWGKRLPAQHGFGNK